MSAPGGRATMWAPGSALVAVVSLTAGLLLSGCSEDRAARSVELDRPTASASPTQEATTPDEPREGEMLRGANAASSSEEQQAAEVWFTYFDELVRLWSTPVADRARLSQLASGPAFEGPMAYAEELVTKNIRLAGGAVVTLLDIEVEGETATVEGCVRTSMHEVDSAGAPLEVNEPWLRATNTLVREGTAWRVRKHWLGGSGKCV